MNDANLNPVPSDYQPGYPRELTQDQINDLLRPGLLNRFSRQTMAAGALVVGVATSGCGGDGPTIQISRDAKQDSEKPDQAAEEQPRRDGSTTSNDSNLKKKVDAIVAEVLGREKERGWYASSTIHISRELKTNPPVKYPSIPISFGNSCVGIFDPDTARAATFRLFEAYGISLQRNVTLQTEGYQLQADGFDPDQKIGFELTMPQGPYGFLGHKADAEPAEKVLTDEERPVLEKDIGERRLNLFLARAEGFPIMDGDTYTPMEYYLGSVVDYLNWVHGDQQLDPLMLLGKLPGRMQLRQEQIEKWQSTYPLLPGCGFESPDVLEHWSVRDAEISLSEKWSGYQAFRGGGASSAGTASLQVTLREGGHIEYTPSTTRRIQISDGAIRFGCRVFARNTEALRLTVQLIGTNDETWQLSTGLDSGYHVTDLTGKRDSLPFRELKGIRIHVGKDESGTFFIDDIGLTHESTALSNE